MSRRKKRPGIKLKPNKVFKRCHQPLRPLKRVQKGKRGKKKSEDEKGKNKMAWKNKKRMWKNSL